MRSIRKQSSEQRQRKKLSTTIAPESDEYLRQLIATGVVRNLAEALDLSIERLRRLDNRLRLERDTIASYAALSPEAVTEESEWEAYSSSAARSVHFDD